MLGDISPWTKILNDKDKLQSCLIHCFFLGPFYSILFYPITLGGRRGTTDEFAAIPFHLDLFSAALVELAKSIPVHSLILSSHLFFCLPLFLFPFTVPWRIVFAKSEDLETDTRISVSVLRGVGANSIIYFIVKFPPETSGVSSKYNYIANFRLGRIYYNTFFFVCLFFFFSFCKANPPIPYSEVFHGDSICFR